MNDVVLVLVGALAGIGGVLLLAVGNNLAEKLIEHRRPPKPQGGAST